MARLSVIGRSGGDRTLRRPWSAAAGGILERYLLRETIKPLTLALIVTLTALVLERVLRLFDMIARGGGSFEAVARMAFNLLPHYLGLALPAAFFIALFIVISSMDDGSELESMFSAGYSPWRLVRPFVAMGCVFALFSVLLFGYLQPYSRYAYQRIADAVRNGPWDARLEAGVVVDAGEGIVITADEVDATGRNLQGVLLRRPRQGGGEQVISAERGALRLAPDGRRLVLTVWNGEVQSFDPDGVADVGRFQEFTVDRAFSTAIPPFRMRGESERELTQTEIYRRLRGADVGGDVATSLPDRILSAEMHSRMARALAVPFLPLLAMTMGVAAKRQRRTLGVIVGAAILVVFQNLLQLGESFGDLGLTSPAVAVWTPWALFTGFCVWAFAYSYARPGRNAFSGVFRVLDAGVRLLTRRLRRTRAGVVGRPA
jgi:lipopolysaccharide export system permease protein